MQQGAQRLLEKGHRITVDDDPDVSPLGAVVVQVGPEDGPEGRR